jgi:hypothetical protein
VGEDFITDSIHNGRLVDGRRAYYRVVGAPETDIANKQAPSPVTAAEVGKKSLAVKKASKEMRTPSPRRSLSTSQDSKAAEAASAPSKATVEQAGPIERDYLPKEYRDALSEAMEEIRAVQHLVCTSP